MDSNAREIASAFVEARRAGRSLDRYPGVAPEDLGSAYAIQDCALGIWEREIGGWKVGRIGPPQAERLGANRLAGPVFADAIVQAGQDIPEMPIFAEGFAAAEAEFMLRLAPQPHPLPADAASAMGWVDEVRIGIEVASSPYAGINRDGPCVTISDQGNNAGLVMGPVVAREHWARLDEVEVSLRIDGRQVGRDTTANMLDGPFGALSFLLANLNERGIEPKAGWWISSGAITGVHEIVPGQQLEAQFESLGVVRASIG